MKNYFKLLAFGFVLVFVSCQEEIETDRLDVQLKSISDLTIETGMTLSEMNAVINAASSGEIVWVEPGTYTIPAGNKVVMKAGVTLRNQTEEKPVFDGTATPESTGLLEMNYYDGQMDDCTIRGITFHNIRFNIRDCPNVKFNYCVFDYGKRKTGTDKTYLNDAYLHFSNTDYSIVDSCVFYRRSGNSGRGIYIYNATNAHIINNTIGENGTRGYFVCAINGSTGTGTSTQIQANTIRRYTSWVNTNETDHGIYMHYFDGVLIKYNTISGWPANSSGGAVKVRNGLNIDIFGNQMTNSGVLLYEYSDATQPYLNYVTVEYNTIVISSNANDIYHGVGYYRDNASGSEYSIRINQNTISNGTIYANCTYLNTANFSAGIGGVYNNDIAMLTLKSGINNSGNY